MLAVLKICCQRVVVLKTIEGMPLLKEKAMELLRV